MSNLYDRIIEYVLHLKRNYLYESPNSFLNKREGTARTHIPHVRNCTAELLTFGVIARVSLSEVQWTDLALGQRSSWSSFDPRQVSMLLRQSSSYISTPVKVWGCGVLGSFEFSRCKSNFNRNLMKVDHFDVNVCDYSSTNVIKTSYFSLKFS